MTSKTLTAELRVAPQIEPTDMPALAGQGIRAIINNRPDGEARGQPSNAALAEAAQRAGLAYCYMPVVSGQIDDGQVTSFAHALAELPGPALGFCRTGTRSTTLWALAAARQGRSVDEILQTAAAAGYDLAGLRRRLEQAGSAAS